MVATALVALTEWGGAHPRIGGLPRWLGVAAGALVMWLVIVGVAAWAAELLRRHHRALAAGAVRHGKRAAVGTFRSARKRGGWLAALLAAWAAKRWAGRGQSWRGRCSSSAAGPSTTARTRPSTARPPTLATARRPPPSRQGRPFLPPPRGTEINR